MSNKLFGVVEILKRVTTHEAAQIQLNKIRSKADREWVLLQLDPEQRKRIETGFKDVQQPEVVVSDRSITEKITQQETVTTQVISLDDRRKKKKLREATEYIKSEIRNTLSFGIEFGEAIVLDFSVIEAIDLKCFSLEAKLAYTRIERYLSEFDDKDASLIRKKVKFELKQDWEKYKELVWGKDLIKPGLIERLVKEATDCQSDDELRRFSSNMRSLVENGEITAQLAQGIYELLSVEIRQRIDRLKNENIS